MTAVPDPGGERESSMMKLAPFRLPILAISAFTVLACSDSTIGAPAMAGSPSFDCAAVEAGSIEDMICQDSALSAFDRELAAVYQAAAEKVVAGQRTLLRTEQRGWIKGRDDCWKSAEMHGCIVKEYQHRIAFLQARYDLIPGTGLVSYLCDNAPDNNILVTYYGTEPPTLVARYGNDTSVMFQQVAASGAKYRGRNEIFWEHHGKALISWGYGAPDMHCKTKARPTEHKDPE